MMSDAEQSPDQTAHMMRILNIIGGLRAQIAGVEVARALDGLAS